MGEALSTPGFRLPADYVVATVGPFGTDPDRVELLASCYSEAFLEAVLGRNATSIAFPCISSIILYCIL